MNKLKITFESFYGITAKAILNFQQKHFTPVLHFI